MVISSASKSVKFQAKTPNSERKKFAKTPHSSKTPKLPEEASGVESPFKNKKRKLSFSNVEEAVAIPSPKTPKKSPEKAKQLKTPVLTKPQTPASLKKKNIKTPVQNTPNKRMSIKTATPTVSAKKKIEKVESDDEEESDDDDEDDSSEGDEDDSDETEEEEDDDEDDSDEEEASDDEGDEDSEDDSQEEEPEIKEAKPKNEKALSKFSPEIQDLIQTYQNMTQEEKKLHKVERTIYVGNLPSNMTKEKIAKEFKQFGKIHCVRLRSFILTDKAKNRKAGVILKQVENAPITAFIKFFDLESARKAVAWNGKLFKGHHLRVDLVDPSHKSQIDKNKAIFVRNLAFDIKDDDLWTAFESCGEIDSVRIATNKLTHRGRGFGFVNFKTPAAVELALKLNETEIKGRPAYVSRYEPTQKKSRMQKKKEGKAKGKGKVGSQKPQEEGKKRSPKKFKKVDNAAKSAQGPSNFAGKQAQLKKKKTTKPSADNLKKKKIAEVLTKKTKPTKQK